MFKKLSTLLLISMLVFSLVLTGCGSGKGNSTGNSETPGTPDVTVADSVGDTLDKPTDEGYGILRNSSGSEGKTLNPHTYETSAEAIIMQEVAGMFYKNYPSVDGTNYDLREELAAGEPIQMDEEGKVWNIELNPEAKWENGEPINADTYMYSFKMLLDPILINRRASNFAISPVVIENAEDYFMQGSDEEIGEVAWEDVGITKIDDYTIEIRAVVPTNAYDLKQHFSHRATAPVYEALYEELMNEDRTETGYGSDRDKFMSSGAFVLDKWIKDNERHYSKNQHFVNKDLVYLAGMHTRVIPNSGTQMQMFDNGELDYVSLSANDFAKYEEDPRVLFSPSMLVRIISINSDNPEQPLLGNKNFRKALFFGLDRDTMSNLSKHKPANYLIPTRNVFDIETGTRWRDMDEAKTFLTPNNGYDPEAALKYFEIALEEEGLDQVTLQLNYYDTDEVIKELSEFMQGALPKIFGEDRFSLKLQALPSAQRMAAMKDYATDPASYELSWGGWEGSEFDPWNVMRVYTSDYAAKNEPFSNARLDELYKEISHGPAKHDPVLKAKYMAEMEEILLDEVPVLPIYEHESKTLKSERLILPVTKWVNGTGFGFRYARIND